MDYIKCKNKKKNKLVYYIKNRIFSIFSKFIKLKR